MPSARPSAKRLLTERLRAFPEILFALLFGSRGREGARPRADSDWDVAVFVDEELSERERFDLRLRVVGEVEAAVAAAGESGEPDVVLLNDAPALLGHRALQGTKLFVRDEVRYVRYFVRTLQRSFDEQYWRELDRRERRRRLEEGRFGRP